MFIQRFVLVLAAVAAAAPLPAQTLVRNGGFQLTATRSGDGSLLSNQLGDWQAAYGTPQVIAGEGCDDPDYVAMRGKQGAGEAIRQPVALTKGVRYDVSFCARKRKGESSNAHVELRASTTPLDSPACPAGTCEAMAGVWNIVKSDWTAHHFQFTPSRDYAYLTITTNNDLAVTDRAKPSWVEVDNVSVTLATRRSGEPAPLINAKTSSAIPDQYIVIFERGTKEDQVEALEDAVDRLDGKVLLRYRTAVLGFAAHLGPKALKLVLANPDVQWVEADQRMRTSSVTEPVIAGACLNAALPTGIDRIDRRLLPLDGTAQFTETGEGVHVYLLDSGIRTAHPEFGDRASGDFSAITDDHGQDDCSGHGTHVAGTLGGTNYGVAKRVRLHSVRVMDCKGEGAESGVILGVEWITARRQRPAEKHRPAVAIMSISGENGLPGLDKAVTRSIESGVTYVVAAHNRARDACHYSPARIAGAITVGAVNALSDMRYVTSNHGSCVDLFAPGTAILSAGIANDTPKSCLSGTSMAAAHVAGVAALYLQLDPHATPSEVWEKIHQNNNVSTTPNWPGILNRGACSPNELLHWGPLNEGHDDADPQLPHCNGR